MAATVLVIDDDSTVRDSVVAYLDDCDYDMQSTGSGQEALDLGFNRRDLGRVWAQNPPQMTSIDLRGQGPGP